MSERKQFRDLAEPAALHAAIDALGIEPGTESVPLIEADGRVAAERIDAGIDVPGFDRSTKDGYAVQAADTFDASEGDPFVADLLGVVEAGDKPETDVESGGVASVATGAPVPPGADAIVPVERTTRLESGAESRIEIRTAVAPGDNIMHSGDDVAAGDRAIGPGTVLTTRDVGLLAAIGVEEVPVVERPTVGIVSTGNELVRPGDPLDDERGQIYDLNTYALAAAVRAAGGEPEVVPHIADDYDRMHETLESVGERCDLVLSSGSTSASDADVLYRVVEDHGSLDLHGVAVKPGRPTIVGEIADTAYIGLPGNPVSALSIFRTFVAPAIREAAGRPPESAPTLDGEMIAPKRYTEGRTYLLPVAVIEDESGSVLVYPVDKGSGAITSLTEADGVVEMRPETELLERGQSVTVDLFSGDTRPPSVLGIGESDPLLSRLLDRIDGPRYLPHGSREGRRRFRDGIPDFALLAPADAEAVDGEVLGTFDREWGLVVPSGNPANVSELADLLAADSFYNLPTVSGLRSALDEALADLAAERDVSEAELADRIPGYDRTVNGIRSPARRVAQGTATVGLGLRFAASELDVDFVPLGTQTLTIVAAPDRVEKPGVRELQSVLETDLPGIIDGTPGYSA
ncbi:molybdopterin biosynthesis protein [Halodesulfurarchaeum sp. HSR-GB]|uniref:molybdopterin biosynthesis protein n=1 Tax=Halodesulfurarchaeum sp. HSR-GB TaxID=3074077 RepID=UPI002855E1FD|nr:molybdopterin biosynthesis protein [Halodesulfurarchaeum sp. HSR-GB]MDR5657323.1 molybdopterin biosynthesis protein [Halodesulfurarchaeum sp. HSR-GB]